MLQKLTETKSKDKIYFKKINYTKENMECRKKRAAAGAFSFY